MHAGHTTRLAEQVGAAPLLPHSRLQQGQVGSLQACAKHYKYTKKLQLLGAS